MKSKTLILFFLFVVANQIFAHTEKKTCSEIIEYKFSTLSGENSLSSDDRYIVKKEVILAATSEANFDLLMNCLINGDKDALKEMINNKQLVYLYRNDVVFLVEPKFKCFIVRKEGL